MGVGSVCGRVGSVRASPAPFPLSPALRTWGWHQVGSSEDWGRLWRTQHCKSAACVKDKDNVNVRVKTMLLFLRSLQSKSDVACHFPNFSHVRLTSSQDLPPFLAELGCFALDFALLLFPRNGAWCTIREKPGSDSARLYYMGLDRKVRHWLDPRKGLKTLCGGLWSILPRLYEISSA